MQTYTATQVRMNIYNLVAQTELNHEPLQITGKKNNAILIAESDWNAIQETLYLLSVPGMGESILEGMKTPLEDCSDTLFDDEK
jgi:antitoxin YefM